MDDVSRAAGPSSEWRDGWTTVGGCMLAMGAGLSMYVAVAGFFVKPLAEAFGWTRGQLSMTSAAILSTSLLLPAVGALADRWGVRPLILVGTIAFAACYLAFAGMTGAYWQYLAILGVIGLIGGPVTAPFVFARPVVVAFARSRGLALALTMSGVPLLSFVVLPVIQRVLQAEGWRAAFLAMAPATLAIGLAAYALVGRGAAACEPAPRAQQGDGLRVALRDPRFWLLAAAMATANVSVGAFLTSLQPLLSDKGVPGPTAAMLGVWQASAVVVGRLVFGILLDRFWPPAVALVALGAPAVGLCVFLSSGPDVAWLAVAIGLIATAIGAEGEILGFFTARYFGLRAFGSVFGVLGLVYGVSVASGGLLSGFMFDAFGDYDRVLAAGAVLAAFSAVAILATGWVRRPMAA